MCITSCKKSATPFLSGHLNPIYSKKSSTHSRGPWYTIWPSDRRIMSSNKSYVSGAGCRSEIRAVPWRICIDCLIAFTIWNVVELSNPVDISSIKSALAGPTIISPASEFNQQRINKKDIYFLPSHHWKILPVVRRFRCPPEIPLFISSPTSVSAHTSSPKIWKFHNFQMKIHVKLLFLARKKWQGTLLTLRI